MMCDSEYATMEQLKALAERAGMDLTQEELEELKPVYELYAEQAAQLHELDLGDGDLALTFSPDDVPSRDGKGVSS